MKQGKILWSENCFGSRVYDQASGVTVLGSIDLLVVDSTGLIEKRLKLDAVSDPRALFLDGRYLVYDTGAVTIGHYTPKSEGLHVWRWLKEVRRVHVYDVRTSHQLWEAPELSVGLPIACSKGELETVKIVNFAQCLQNPKTLPRVAITGRDVRTGRIRRQAVLSSSRSASVDIFGNSLGLEPIEVARVHWTVTRVYINGLLGKNYVGHRALYLHRM